MKISHFFLPHPETHKKAHLLSFKALIVYILFFLVLTLSFKSVEVAKPGVLGVSSGVDQQELIRLTNVQRQQNGLPALSEDSRLDAAAQAKGENMFAENYWAHFSPSGKDPWGFIQKAGYNFTYAGENLAKSFYNSPDVVNAWMNSRTHRENILNNHYKNVGIAVLEGTLNGQKTTLVVQEFGSEVGVAVAQAPKAKVAETAQQLVKAEETVQPVATLTPAPSARSPLPLARSLVAGTQQTAEGVTVDPYLIMKVAGLSILSLLFILILVDLYIIRRRAIVRISARHLPHLALISVAGSALLHLGPGSIL